MSPRIDLTQEAINAARKWFADNALACAMAAHSRSDSVLQNGEVGERWVVSKWTRRDVPWFMIDGEATMRTRR